MRGIHAEIEYDVWRQHLLDDDIWCKAKGINLLGSFALSYRPNDTFITSTTFRRVTHDIYHVEFVNLIFNINDASYYIIFY